MFDLGVAGNHVAGALNKKYSEVLFHQDADKQDPLSWVCGQEGEDKLFEQLESFAALAIIEGIKIRLPRDPKVFRQFSWFQKTHKDRSRFPELSAFSGLVTQGYCANGKFGTFPIM